MAQAQTAPTDVTDAPDDHGAYLSLVFGNGRIHGGNAEGNRWMRGRTFEIRAGRQQRTLFGSPLPDSLSERIDFVHYNEGHPDNNHRDGFAVQWLMVRQLGARSAIELGVGPYLSMNTTVIDGRQIDDANVGALFSLGLRVPLGDLPAGTHLRIGYNHVQMRNVHRSDALMIGIGRQFGRSEPDPETDPANGRTWFGASRSATRSRTWPAPTARTPPCWKRGATWARGSSTGPCRQVPVRRRRRRPGRPPRLAGQLWYVQTVTPRFAMSAGLGPYVARNRRDDNITHANLLITFQAEQALSRHARAPSSTSTASRPSARPTTATCSRWAC
jgi:hypothetical protein